MEPAGDPSGQLTARGTWSDRPAELGAQLDGCRRRLIGQVLVRRLLLWLAVGLALPLAVVVADHLAPAGLPRRVVLAAGRVSAGVLGAVAVAVVVVSWWRRLNPLFAARLLERTGGIRHNSLINAVLVGQNPTSAHAQAAAAHQALAEMRAHPPRRLSEPGALRLPLVVLSAVLVVWVGYYFAAPKPVWPSLARFFGADLAAPTATWLEQLRPEPGEIVHAGEALALEFRVHGRAAEEVRFDVYGPEEGAREAAAGYALLRASGKPAGRWRLTLAPHEVLHDIHYTCTANDASLSGVIPIRPLPAVSELRIELEPPAYAGRPTRTTVRADLDVLAGTRATFRALANTPVREAVFVLAGERETRTRMNVDPGDPRRLTLSLLLTEGGEYRLEFSDAWGYSAPDPPGHSLVVRPDAAPSVEIVTPAAEQVPAGIVDVTVHAVLVVAARDDVGLRELVLVREHGGVHEALEVSQVRDVEGRQARGEVATTELGLQPGEGQRIWFEARDGRTGLDGRPAPQTTRTRVLTLAWPVEVVRARRLPDSEARSSPDAAGDAVGGERVGQIVGEEREDAAGTPTSQVAGEPTADDEADVVAGESEEDFERELERFVREHGEMAREVSRQAEEAGESAERSERSDESPDAGETPPPDAGQPADSEGGCDQSGEAAKPESDAVGEAQPDADEGAPADSTSQSGESAGESEAEQSAEEPAGEGGEQEGAEEAQEGAAGDSAEEQSSAEAGQQSGEGTGSRRVDPPADDEPDLSAESLEEQRRSAGGQRGELESMGLPEVLDLLEMRARGQVLSEDMLVEMGWPESKAAGFVKALERLHELAGRSGVLDAARTLRFATPLGEADVQPGAGLAADLATAVSPAELRADKLGRIAPPPEQQVPSHLRALLEAYYRALAEENGG